MEIGLVVSVKNNANGQLHIPIWSVWCVGCMHPVHQCRVKS